MQCKQHYKPIVIYNKIEILYLHSKSFLNVFYLVHSISFCIHPEATGTQNVRRIYLQSICSQELYGIPPVVPLTSNNPVYSLIYNIGCTETPPSFICCISFNFIDFVWRFVAFFQYNNLDCVKKNLNTHHRIMSDSTQF